MSKGKIAAIVTGAVLVVVGIPLLVYFLTYATAETRGRIALHNQQRDAAHLQASYEYFHDTCRDVLAKTQNITVAQQSLDAAQQQAPASDPFGQYEQQVLQMRTQLLGLTQIRDEEAQGYNAKSHEFTVNFMRSRDLPLEIGPPNGVPYSQLRCENQQGN